jgi:hypothetical protein
MDSLRYHLPGPGLICGALLMAAGPLPGCGPLGDQFSMPGATNVPSELVPFQGRWKFDEARTCREDGGSDDEEITAQDQALLDAMKQIGVVMSDIEIRGTQITQLGGLIQAQYDLLDYSGQGDRVFATALWHEDRHDPGDATEIKVTLERTGDTLVFTREEDGFAETYYFKRS